MKFGNLPPRPTRLSLRAFNRKLSTIWRLRGAHVMDKGLEKENFALVKITSLNTFSETFRPRWRS